jgi:glycosyltransferase involved in cell wall biosynthesis
VVLDHARYFTSHCKSLVLFVINETGQVYEQALQYGINIFCVRNQKLELGKYLDQKHFDLAFFHHTYGYLPAFRPHTNELVEVIHNEYSWQKDVEFFETIRAEAVDKFIAVSDPVREYSIANLAIKPESIVTIVNGLNIEGLIRPPIEVLQWRRNGTLKASPTFVMCANGQSQKNHVLAIRAFIRLLKKHPRAKLQLAGNLFVDEIVEKAIAAELEKCGSPANIELMGSLNRRELSSLLAKAHIALLPTKYEGFSIATLEYLYFGLPMILSNTGGASYISKNYDNIIIDQKIVRAAGAPAASEVKSLAENMSKMIKEYAVYSEKSEVGARSYPNYTVEAVCFEYLKSKA